MKKLFKSYRFWSALAGSLGLLVVSIAKLFGYTMSSVVIEELIMAVCGVLVVLGIVKKPEQSEKDDTIANDDNKVEKSNDDLNNQTDKQKDVEVIDEQNINQKESSDKTETDNN